MYLLAGGTSLRQLYTNEVERVHKIEDRRKRAEQGRCSPLNGKTKTICLRYVNDVHEERA